MAQKKEQAQPIEKGKLQQRVINFLITNNIKKIGKLVEEVFPSFHKREFVREKSCVCVELGDDDANEGGSERYKRGPVFVIKQDHFQVHPNNKSFKGEKDHL
jgi:hypothetical protein